MKDKTEEMKEALVGMLKYFGKGPSGCHCKDEDCPIHRGWRAVKAFEALPPSGTTPRYEFLSDAFLDAMNDIGRYGHEKYGADSFQARRLVGDNSRGELKRCTSQVIADHAREHFSMYLSHVAHDHFNDDVHQLAAVAFNAMMEGFFAGLLPPSGAASEATVNQEMLAVLKKAQRFISRVDDLHQTIYSPGLDDECLKAISRAEALHED